MPIYEYACQKCGHEFEREQRITEDPIKNCPACGAARARRLISRTSFLLKGGGWYNDLYSSARAPEKKAAEGGGESDAKEKGAKEGGESGTKDKGAKEGGESGTKDKGAAKKTTKTPASKDSSKPGGGSDPKAAA